MTKPLFSPRAGLVIKIDADGHELDVLEGARETLRDRRPVVLFEIGDYLLKEWG
jgi:FkbM family methyltransferase